MTYPFFRLSAMLIVLAVVMFAYGAWYRAIANESEHSAALSLEIETKAAARNRTSALRETLGKLASDEALVAKYFVSSDTVVSFLEELQRHGTEAGATVDVLSVSSESDDEQQVLRVTLHIAGSFRGVMNAVGRIEYAPYDLSVQTLSLQSRSSGGSEEGASTTTWDGSLTILVGASSATSTTSTSSRSSL